METFYSGSTVVRVGYAWDARRTLDPMLMLKGRPAFPFLRYTVVTTAGDRRDGTIRNQGGTWMQRAADVLGWLLAQRQLDPIDLDVRGELVYLARVRGERTQEHPYR
jgi:hypothetical protein